MKICVSIIGMIMAITSMTSLANAEEHIEIFTLQSEIEKTDSIFVTGFVDVESSYKPIKLEMYDSNNNLIFRPNVNVNDDGQFSWLFNPPLGKFTTTGTYTIIASHEELDETSIMQFTVVEDTGIDNSWIEKIKSNTDDNVNQSILLSGNIEQENTGSHSSKIAVQKDNANFVQVSEQVEISKANIEKSSTMKTLESTDISQQEQNTEIIMTVVALSIAGMVSGVVIWMRTTCSKPMIQR